MIREDLLDFSRKNPVCYLATNEAGQPRVRGMLLWFADDTGFYFSSADTKSLAKQLRADPRVEVCFARAGSTGATGMSALRVSGAVEFLEQSDLTERLHRDRPWLNDFKTRFPDSREVIFRIAHGEAHFWTLADNMKENEIKRVRF